MTRDEVGEQIVELEEDLEEWVEVPLIVGLASSLGIAGANIDQFGDILTDSIPLLTRDEEQAFAEIIQAGRTAQEKLDKLREASPHRLLKRELEAAEAWWLDVQVGEVAAWRLVFHNLRFAYWAALVSLKRDPPHGNIREVKPRFRDDNNWGGRQLTGLVKFADDPLPLADRFQAAVLGLLRAAEKFQPSSTAKFVSFAGYDIQNAIERAVLVDRYRNELGPGQAISMNATMTAIRNLRRRTGHEPSIGMIAADSDQGLDAVDFRLEEADLRPFEPAEVRAARLHPLYDWAVRSRLEPEDVIWDPKAPNGPDYVRNRALLETIEAVLDTLNERESFVILHRYGFYDGEPKSYWDTGKVIGLSRERVRQIEGKALDKLREPKRKKLLQPYRDRRPDWPWPEVSSRRPKPKQPRRVKDWLTAPELYPLWLRMQLAYEW